MTAQEILERITVHRANLVKGNHWVPALDTIRKFNEIEWALQTLAEKLVELETKSVT